MTHNETIAWLFQVARYSGPATIAALLVFLPAVHAVHVDVPPPAFAHPPAVAAFIAPAHAEVDSPHQPEPDQTMPGPASTVVITGASTERNPNGHWEYKSLTEYTYVPPSAGHSSWR